MIQPSDDRLHLRSKDPYWSESAWFGFTVPEREMSGIIYFYHRPNMKLSAGGVMLWDPSGDDYYDCLAFDWESTQALPDGADMYDFSLDNGLTVNCLEPLNRYHIHHKGACEFDLTFDGVQEVFEGLPDNPVLIGWTEKLEEHATGHYQQVGRFTGVVRVAGEEIAIDSMGMRDHSWGPRRLSRIARGDWMWGLASAESSFAVTSVSLLPVEEDPFVGTTETITIGQYTRDGVASTVAAGHTRVLERGAGGRPLRVVVDGTDELGRELHAEGRCINALSWPCYDALYEIPCTTLWDFDGQQAWGEEFAFFTTPAARKMLRGGLGPR